MPSAIVTGASAGIGRAIAHRLHRLGYDLTLAARRRERLDAVAADMGSTPRQPVAVYDAADADGAATLVRTHLDSFDRLDLVVANAGLGLPDDATSTSALDDMYAVNARAAFALAAASMEELRASAARGGSPWFIVTSSIVGTMPAAGFAGYSAMKAAQVSLSQSINIEESANSVRACAVCPAFVATDMTAWMRDRLAPEQMLDADDVANAVEFLVGLSRKALVPELVLGRAGAPHPLAP